ncbi:MAG: pentapeptide repeat-containing protein [Lentisphaerae bacterium]|nr:pentapeptide repeat-containing protein [Lentisphaerota bacterium]
MPKSVLICLTAGLILSAAFSPVCRGQEKKPLRILRVSTKSIKASDMTREDCIERATGTAMSKDLRGAKLNDADLSGANLNSADLGEALLKKAILKDCSMSRANLVGANMEGAILDGSVLTGANLTGANLTGATLTKTRLNQAQFTGANLSKANLSKADLTGADLTGATLADTKLDGAILTGATLADGSPYESVSRPTPPEGPPTGTTNSVIEFQAGYARCDLNHPVQYQFDWGNGQTSQWYEVEDMAATNGWPQPNTYSIKNRARCSVNEKIVSEWSSPLPVNIQP